MKTTQAELNAEFENFAKAKKLEIGKSSHFENGYGSKYQTAVPYTVALKRSERCDSRVAIILHLPHGCISPLTSFLKPAELVCFMYGATHDIKKQIAAFKK